MDKIILDDLMSRLNERMVNTVEMMLKDEIRDMEANNEITEEQSDYLESIKHNFEFELKIKYNGEVY